MNKNLFISSLITLVFLTVIAYLNFGIIRYFFEGEFNQNLASIEISYIQMAKFWVEGGGLWQPLWYLGYPWHVFYTPLLPFLEILQHSIFGFSYAHAYRVITGLGYVLAPLSLFLFVWQISKSKTGAFISALFYSFVPSVISLIFAEVGADTLSGVLEPRRFTILVRWGEGPHILALVFLPLFGFFLSRFLEKNRFPRPEGHGSLLLAQDSLHLRLESRSFFARNKLWDLVGACIFLGLVALTNAIVLWAAILLMLSFFLSELTKKSAEFISTVKGFLLLGIISMGFVAFWYNLPFVFTFFREGGSAFNNWKTMFPWGFLPLLAIFTGLFLIIKKITSKFTGLPFSIFWFLMLFGIVYIYYASGENRLEYVPQALRLNTEVDMALSVLAGVSVSNLFLFITQREYKTKYIQYAQFTIAVLIIGALGIPILVWVRTLLDNLPYYARPMTQIENTAEYRVAEKLRELTSGTDQRVLAPGNYGFWLNYFEPVPQLRGALYQSSTHYWPEHIYYQFTNGTDAEISLSWLKIANVGKLVYTTSASAEPYKDYKVPRDKFDSILSETYAEGGDVFYSVPLKNDVLAKVIDRNALKVLKKPVNAIDNEAINKYLLWLEEKSNKQLHVSNISNNHWQIKGEINDGEAVLFQQTYDSGWRVKGKGDWKVTKDPMDFVVLVPERSGPFEVNLVYGKPFSVYLGYLITLATIAFMGWKVVKEQFKLKRDNNG